MKKMQRWISFLLALVMVIGMIPPMAARAEETEPTEETEAVVLAEETTAPMESVTEPSEETTAPTEPVTEPSEETTAPTEPVTEPSEETTVPTEPVTEPSEETTAPTEPATEPTKETVPAETVTGNASADAMLAATSGTCGDNLTWSCKDGVLSIAGTGPMDSFDREIGSPWYPLRKEILAAEIGDGITTIGDNAFFGCTAMKSIRIPATVTTISATAFDDCHQLEAVQYDGSLEQWNSMTNGWLAEYVFPAVSGFGLRALSAEDQTPDVGVSEDFLLPVDQITDVEDIPEGFTAIYDEEGLRAIAEDMSGKYILMKDIHVEGGHWPGLWGYGDPFSGELEGNGHTISGLYYQEWNSSDVRFGLFEEIDGAKISNLKVVGGYNNTTIGSVNDYVILGGLAGDATGNIQINNCVSDMEFTSITTSAYTVIYTGGIIGRYKGTTDTASINSCRNIADIAAMDISGGIVGYCKLTSSELTIYNCRNDANITFSKKVVGNDNSNTAGAFGGIAGYISGSNSQTVISLCMNKGNINVGQAGGGIAGCAYCGPDMTVASCVNTGNVNGRNIGGIVGRASEEGIIQDCLNTGAITMGNSIDDAGGIAGDGGKYYRCVNVGKVKGDSWGFNSAIVHQPGSSFSTEEEAAAAVVDCYWLDDGQTNTLYTMASYSPSETPRTIRTRGRLTLEELAKKESFIGFDFTNVWMMNPVLGHPVPVGIRLPMNMEIEEVGDNQAITLNHSGDTYAYFKSKPDFMYIYTLEGFPNSAGTAQSQADGLIRIHLGHYKEHGIFKGKITFKAVSTVDSIDVMELDRPKTFDIKVTVNPLEYSQNWQISLDGKVGAALSAGGEFDIGAFKAKATLGEISAEVEAGGSMNASMTSEGGSQTLELTTEWSVDPEVGVESGITGEVLGCEVKPVHVSAGVGATGTGVYGIRIRDYSADNFKQQRAVATFYLGEVLKLNPANIILRGFQEDLAEYVYAEGGVETIAGEGAAFSRGYDVGVADVGYEYGSGEGDVVPVFALFKSGSEVVSSISQTRYSNGEQKYSTNYSSSENMSTIMSNSVVGKLGLKHMGMDKTVEVQKSAEGKKLQSTSLDGDKYSKTSLILGESFTADYDQYTFEGDSLDELVKNTSNIGSYLNGTRFAATNKDMEEISNVISSAEVPIAYSNQEKTQKIHTLGFDIGVTLGVGVDLGASLSYMEAQEHETKSGYAYNDEILLTSKSDEQTINGMELHTIFLNSLESLAKEALNFFKKTAGSIVDGVKGHFSEITGRKDSLSNRTLFMTYPTEEGDWNNSYYIPVKRNGVIRTAEMAKAVTIARPIVVSVTEADGTEVTDLSDEPLEFIIRYTEGELAAAGVEGEIGMYRCSDDGDYFEYVGGIQDAAAGTVTATIDKPGQYTLAVYVEDKETENPGDSGSTVIPGTLTAKSATVELEDLVYINFYYVYEGGNIDLTQEYIEANGGMLVWPAAYYPGDELAVVGHEGASEYRGFKLNPTNNRYKAQTAGVPLKNLNDDLVFRGYIQLEDGSYVYSASKEYSGRTYAENRIKNIDKQAEPSEKLVNERAVCIAMLNAIAAAQRYFGYQVDDPANAGLSAERQEIGWDGSMLTPAAAVDPNKTLERDTAVFTGRSGTLNLEGRAEINFYFAIPEATKAAAQESGVLFWSASDYAAAEELNRSTATYDCEMSWDAGKGRWAATYPQGFATKRYEDTIYSCAYLIDSAGEIHYSGVVSYSVEAYCSNQIKNNKPEADICKYLVNYGEAAQTYFGY